MVIVPNVDSEVVKQLWGKCFTFCPQHLWYFNQDTLKLLYEKAGLREIHHETIEREYLPWAKSRFGLDPYDFVPLTHMYPDHWDADQYQGYKIVSIAQKML